MDKTITVKGAGKVSARPDLIIISINLEAQSQDYENTLAIADNKLEKLRSNIQKSGFGHDDLKTESFDIMPQFESIQDKSGNYKRVFKGYRCPHSLKIEFDYDMNRLSQLISVLAHSDAQPEFSISFSVRDKEAAQAQMLKRAAENARQKAQILCEASGVVLGELITIDYNWGEIDFYSKTSYEMNNKCMMPCEARSIDIVPDDIDMSDTATFVWTIN
ncbi:MAG: SIMPL domain-containing protein [Oscillospiraceae bacterium]|nr:SIMPL domain-containing protein [Oscillospiraceae bacterium]